MQRLGRTMMVTGALAVSACGAMEPAQPTFGVPGGLAQSLGPGWVDAPLPDTKLGPGAIVQITPVGKDEIDLRWLGSLAGSCQVPSSALTVTKGGVGQVRTDREYSIGVQAAASVAKVGAEVGAKGARSAQLTVKKASADALDLIRFRSWLAVPTNAAGIDTRCGSTLREPNVYVVQEAFVVSDGSFTFLNDAGVKVGVTPPPTVPVKIGLDASGKSNGDLVITQPIVFAIHRMQQAKDGSFRTLGQESAEVDANSVLAGKRIRNVSGL